jgi:hypothetical protein
MLRGRFRCSWFEVLLVSSCFWFSSRLPGGGITFFAAAKKVIKESSFFNQTLHVERASGLMFLVGNNSPPPRRPARPVKRSVRAIQAPLFS